MTPGPARQRAGDRMTATISDISELVAELKSIVSETGEDREIVTRVRGLVQQLCDRPDWVREAYFGCDAEQGFGVHLLHEEPDHSLAVFALAWLPGKGVPPHDHGTWAVVGGVHGTEHNIDWRRIDDGSRPDYADIERSREVFAGPGEVMAFLPDDIHSVTNESDEVTLSLHVYGKHINYTGRRQYDPATNTVEPLVLKLEKRKAARSAARVTHRSRKRRLSARFHMVE